jgi:GTP-binding protein HflX
LAERVRRPADSADFDAFTHIFKGEKLTQDDLTDLALLRLDLMSIIQVERETGLPGLVFSAHLLPATENGMSPTSKILNFLNPRFRRN